MREYHKIETVFNRSTDGDKRLIWGDYRNETVEYLANTRSLSVHPKTHIIYSSFRYIIVLS